MIVIFRAAVGEVVTAADAATDDTEEDETGDDSSELILVSLELLLSSPQADCLAGGNIGLIVNFGTTVHSTGAFDKLPGSTKRSWFCSVCPGVPFGGSGFIVSFGIELELMLEC